jgi:hypothetical protein
MKKKSLVWGLYRSVRDEKMTSFFSNNFAEERSQQFFLSTMNDRDQSIDIVITVVLHSVGMKHRSLASASENACA